MTYTFLQIGDTSKMGVALDSSFSTTSQCWFWIAVLESFILIFLIFQKNRKRKNTQFDEQIFNEARQSKIDMSNVVNSMYQSKELYDKLKVKCHPDRFPEEENKKIADDLFQELTKNKRNHNRLLELKKEAEQKLNIQF